MKAAYTPLTILLSIIAVLLMLIVRPLVRPDTRVTAADVAKFDHVLIVSPVYLYQGRQGILVLDKRNGNVWFIAKGDDIAISFRDPVFVVRLPLEKLDNAPR